MTTNIFRSDAYLKKKTGYGLRSIFHHLDAANAHPMMVKLLEERAWIEHSISFDVSRRRLANDIEIALKHLQEQGFLCIHDYVVFSALFSSIGSLAVEYPLEALVLMTDLGEQEQAENLIGLFIDPVARLKAYARIIEEHIRLGRTVEASRLIASVEGEIRSMQDGDIKDRTSIMLAPEYGRMQQPDQALELLAMVGNERIRQLGIGATATAIAQQGDGKLALSFVDHTEAPDVNITVAADCHLYTGPENGELWEEIDKRILAFLPEITPEKYEIEIITMVVRSLFIVGKYAEARNIAERFLDGRWHVRSLRVLARNGEAEKALRLFHQTPSEVRGGAEASDIAQIYGMAGDVENAIRHVQRIEKVSTANGAWGAIIWQLAELDKAEQVVHFIDNITEGNIRWWTLAGLGQAEFHQGNMEKAHEYLDQIRAEVGQINSEEVKLSKLPFYIFGEVPNESEAALILMEDVNDDFLCEAIDVLVKIGQIEKAQKTATLIQNPNILVEKQLDFIKTYVSAHNFRTAEAVIASMVPARRDNGYSILFNGLLERGRYEEATKITNRLTNSRAKDNAWKSFSNVYAGKGDFDNASIYLSKIRSPSVIVQATIEYAMFLAKAGDVDAALRILEEQGDTKSTRRAYSSIAAILLSSSNDEKSLGIFDRLKGTDQHRHAVVMLAKKYFANRKFDEALRLIEELPENDVGRAVLGLVLAIAQESDLADVDMAMKLLPKQFGISLDAPRFMILLQKGKVDEAKAILSRFNNSREKHVATRRLIKELAKHQRIEEALMLVTSQVDPSGHDAVLSDIGRELAEHGHYEEALSLLDRIQGAEYRSLIRKKVMHFSLVEYYENPNALSRILIQAFDLARLRGISDVLDCFEDSSLVMGALLKGNDEDYFLERVRSASQYIQL